MSQNRQASKVPARCSSLTEKPMNDREIEALVSPPQCAGDLPPVWSCFSVLRRPWRGARGPGAAASPRPVMNAAFVLRSPAAGCRWCGCSERASVVWQRPPSRHKASSRGPPAILRISASERSAYWLHLLLMLSFFHASG